MRRKKPRKPKYHRNLNVLDTGLIVLILAALGNRTFPANNNFHVPIPADHQSFGIDVSHHQGTIQWDTLLASNAVSPSIDFVFVKATEGMNWIDPEWERNRTALKENNIKHGAYHFYQSKAPATIQARHFLNVWQPNSDDLPPVLDIEIDFYTAYHHKDSIKTWLKIVESTSGFRPIIYCSLDDYQRYYKQLFSEHQFWLAAYSRNLRLADMPNIIYWQFTEDAILPHHKGVKIDANISTIRFN